MVKLSRRPRIAGNRRQVMSPWDRWVKKFEGNLPRKHVPVNFKLTQHVPVSELPSHSPESPKNARSDSGLILRFLFGRLDPRLTARLDRARRGRMGRAGKRVDPSVTIPRWNHQNGDPMKESSSRALNPIERWSEVLFGLIMTLSFTGTLSIVSGGREEVLTMLLSVVGCNVAWGIIDAVLYLLGSLSERGRNLVLYKAVRSATSPDEARALIAEAIPPVVASVIQPAELESLRSRLSSLPDPPARPRILRQEIKGAVGVFLLVFLSCVPVIIPFLLIREPWTALRVSNGVAVVMLFLGGHMLARYAGFRKVRTGLWMVLLGLVMVAITIALGG